MLFVSVFEPVLLSGQISLFFDSLSWGATVITLPKEKLNHSYGKQFVVANEEEYKAIFADSLHATLPKIDFTRNELIARFYCTQCFVRCGDRPGCHPNACRYSRTWNLVEKKNRLALTVQELYGKNCSYFPVFAKEIICRDDSTYSTLIKSCAGMKKDSVDFNQQIVVARKMYVDCAAEVKHEFYLDTAQRCLVWRLYNGYRGCHSMKEDSFIFIVPKLPEGYVVRFEKYEIPSEY